MDSLSNKLDFLKRFVNLMLALTVTTTARIAVEIYIKHEIQSQSITKLDTWDYWLILITSLLVFIVSVRFFFGLFLYIFKVEDYKYVLFFIMCIIQSIIFSLHSFTLNLGVRSVFIVFVAALFVDFVGFLYILKFERFDEKNKLAGYLKPLITSFKEIMKLIKTRRLSQQIIFLVLFFIIIFILNFFNLSDYNFLTFIVFIAMTICINFILLPTLYQKETLKDRGKIEWRWAFNNMLGFLILLSISIVDIINNGFQSAPFGMTKHRLLYFSALFCGFYNSYVGLNHSLNFYRDSKIIINNQQTP